MTYSTLHVLVFCFGPLSLSLSHSLLVDVLPPRVLVFVLYILPPVHYCSHPSLLLLSEEQFLQGGVFVIPDDVMQTDPFLFSVLYSLLLYSHHTRTLLYATLL